MAQQSKKKDDPNIDMEAVVASDPLSPYDYKSVTLIIRSQAGGTKGKRLAEGHKQRKSRKPLIQHHSKDVQAALPSDLTDVKTFLHLLRKIVTACNKDNTMLHSEVCS